MDLNILYFWKTRLLFVESSFTDISLDLFNI